MARFHGKVGYAAESVEKAAGVYEEQVVEYPYFGDVIRNTRQLQDGEKVNNNLTVDNSISIVADAYAREHFHAIRYVEWAGARWEVSNVEERSPRLLLRLGGVYHGPTPGTPESP